MIYFPLVFAIIIRAFTDVFFKAAVNNIDFSNDSLINNIKKIISNPFMWFGVLFGFLNLISWLYSLKFFDLSYAYPFLSISYIGIILMGKFIFKEHLDKDKIIGIIFICLGALVLFTG